MSNSLKDNYIELSKKFGGTHALISKGAKKGIVNSIMRGSIPKANELYAVAQILNVSVETLLHGEGPESTSPPDDFVHIPLYDIRAGAGGGALVDREEIKDVLAFRKDWITNELQVSEKDLSALFVQGDSMTPTLSPGDIILIVKNKGETLKDGIYVIRLDGGLLVKRLQKLPGGVIKVTSDNQAYEPYEISESTKHDDFSIVGRVVWAGRRF